ncbi:hypothetical protein LINPERHAP2_LOCUS7833 [Linum perenne]
MLLKLELFWRQFNWQLFSTQSSRIKSDCLTLVNALRTSNSSWPWQCHAWLLLLKDLLRRNPRIDIAFIPQGLNCQFLCR